MSPLMPDAGRCSPDDAYVQSSPDHAKAEAVAAIVKAQAKLVGGDSRACVGHAHHRAAKGAVVVAVAIKLDVEAFDLGRQIVGEGILDAAANRPTPVVVVVAIVEQA